MALLKVEAFSAGSSKSGVSLSQGTVRDNVYFRLGLTRAAQLEFFGKVFDPDKDQVALVLTNEANLKHLVGIHLCAPDAADGLQISGGVNGSVGLCLRPWCTTSPGKRPAVTLEVVNRKVSANTVSFKLPNWARPGADPRTRG